GCAGPGAAEQAKASLSAAPVTITFFKRQVMTDADVDVMMKEWYAKHPTWKVELTQGKGFLEALTPHIASGDKMDVLGWFQTVRAFQQRTGIPLLLDEYIKRDKYDVRRFNAKERDLVGRIDGKLYSLLYAYGGNLTSYFYNRALLKQSGVPEPPADWSKAWTWDEFRDVLRRLTKKDGGTTTQIGITHYGDPVTSLLVLSDAKWVSDDWKKISSTEGELLQTIERWADVTTKDGATMASPGVDVGTTNNEQAFLTGRVAMYPVAGGPANPAKKLTDAGMDWGFMVSPKMKYASPEMQSNIILLTKLGAYPEHGWELLKYLIEENRWGAMEGRFPAIQDEAQRWARETFKHNPNARTEVLAETVKIARPVDKYAYHPGFGELNKVIQPVLADIWAGKATARAALPPLQAQLQGIMDQFPVV
ncbi:MAG: ABC transporter substrate-binding protein, partial [Chloroflexota bacterium]|nr:ABC transporter substrate-binding protein [Chloroflexota bacterium]